MVFIASNGKWAANLCQGDGHEGPDVCSESKFSWPVSLISVTGTACHCDGPGESRVLAQSLIPRLLRLHCPTKVNCVRWAQEAAGAFQYLQSRVVPSIAAPRPEDLTPECAGMLSTLCLAQVTSSPCAISCLCWVPTCRIDLNAQGWRRRSRQDSMYSREEVPHSSLSPQSLETHPAYVLLLVSRLRSASTSRRLPTTRRRHCWQGTRFVS